MLIESFICGPLFTNAYVLACRRTRKAVIIDPAYESTSLIVEYVKRNNLIPEKILLTHSHWDHLADLPNLLEVIPLPVYVHKEDAENVKQPGSDNLPLLFPIKGVGPTHFFEDGDKITVGELILQVIHTPGHSPGGVCFYCDEYKVLISGDTLFKGSIGNINLPTSKAKDLWCSLGKLSCLPKETKVYPGHGESTTLEGESWLVNAKNIFGS